MMTTKKIAGWTLVVTAAGSAIAAAAWQLPKGSASAPTTQSSVSSGNVSVNGGVGPTIGDDGCVVLGGGSCLVGESSNVEDVRKLLRALPNATLPPTGQPPYLFTVVGTGPLGLYVRNGFTKDDTRLAGDPVNAEGLGVYVDCQVDNGWIADPTTSGGGRWYKIRYPQVSNIGDFWSYSAYLEPTGHNGNVPACTTDQRKGN